MTDAVQLGIIVGNLREGSYSRRMAKAFKGSSWKLNHRHADMIEGEES